MDLIDIYRAFHPKAAEHIIFPTAHGTFSRMDHMLGHKTNLNKLRKTEIIPSIISDQNGMSPEINYNNNNNNNKISAKNTNMCRLNNMLLHNFTEEIKEEIKNAWRQIKMEIQNLRDIAKAVLREESL